MWVTGWVHGYRKAGRHPTLCFLMDRPIRGEFCSLLVFLSPFHGKVEFPHRNEIEHHPPLPLKVKQQQTATGHSAWLPVLFREGISVISRPPCSVREWICTQGDLIKNRPQKLSVSKNLEEETKLHGLYHKFTEQPGYRGEVAEPYS